MSVFDFDINTCVRVTPEYLISLGYIQESMYQYVKVFTSTCNRNLVNGLVRVVFNGDCVDALLKHPSRRSLYKIVSSSMRNDINTVDLAEMEDELVTILNKF